ncbi:hypothetical protein D3C72_1771310 [compost metagenome]
MGFIRDMSAVVIKETSKKRRRARGRLRLSGDLKAPLQQPAGAAADIGPPLIIWQGPIAFRDQDGVHGADQVGGRFDEGSVKVESNGCPIKGGQVGHGAELLLGLGDGARPYEQ